MRRIGRRSESCGGNRIVRGSLHRRNAMLWEKLSHVPMICLMASFWTLCAACAPQAERVVLAPPAELLADCPHPPVPETMVRGSLRDYAVGATRRLIDYAEALDVCNAQLAAIREWRETMEARQ